MSILKRLPSDDDRVVYFNLSRNKDVVQVIELCDGYFYSDLNKEDFGLLINELKDIHQQMIDTKK